MGRLAQFPPKFSIDMCYVYILKSLRNKKWYTGSTRVDPNKRLKQHNYGANKWSRENRPFELLYFEKHTTYNKARKRENYLKTTSGRRSVGKLVNSWAH